MHCLQYGSPALLRQRGVRRINDSVTEVTQHVRLRILSHATRPDADIGWVHTRGTQPGPVRAEAVGRRAGRFRGRRADVDTRALDEKVLAAQTLRYDVIGKRDKSKRAERPWNIDIKHFTVVGEERSQIIGRYVLRAASDEDLSTCAGDTLLQLRCSNS